MAKQKFNVGDKVTILNDGNCGNSHKFQVGLITGTFKSRNRTYKSVLYYVVVPYSNQKEELYLRAHDIEMVDSVPAEEESSDSKIKVESKSSLKITNEQLNRMSVELEELTERLVKLNKFIGGNRFCMLDEITKKELRIQSSAMTIYQEVLSSRYNRLINSNTNVPLNMD